MKERIMDGKDPVAFTRELILYPISKGFCYLWKTGFQAL
jgi:hypothetical protein